MSRPAAAVPPPVELSPEDQELLARLVEAKAARAACEETIEKLKQELRNVLAEAQAGMIGGEVVLRDIPGERTTVDPAALKRDYPEVYDRVVKTTTTRTMTVYRRRG
jgi:predicted phage-related endonuclease